MQTQTRLTRRALPPPESTSTVIFFPESHEPCGLPSWPALFLVHKDPELAQRKCRLPAWFENFPEYKVPATKIHSQDDTAQMEQRLCQVHPEGTDTLRPLTDVGRYPADRGLTRSTPCLQGPIDLL